MAPPGLGHLKSITNDAVTTAAREDGLLHGKFIFRAGIEPPADIGVFALVILAHDDKIDLARSKILYRGLDPRKQAHRPDVGVLLELAANRNQQAPQRDVIGHARVAYRAQKNRIEGPKLLQSVFRHHAAGFQIALATPVELFPGERKTEAARRGLGDANAFRHYFLANAIAGNGSDFVASRSGSGHPAAVRQSANRSACSYRARSLALWRN